MTYLLHPRRKVCVAVPTFRRSEMLRALLEGLARQTVDADQAVVTIVVLDNDRQGSGRVVFDDFASRFPGRSEYIVVADRGLSAVRNHALAFATGRFDFLAMIDDDEVPDHQWLSELLRVQGGSSADAVIGPVPRRFPDGVPKWIKTGDFFVLPRYADGAVIPEGYSGNCLLNLGRVAQLGLSFDRKLDLAGGEDQLFFRQMTARRGRIVYAADAIAWETVPRARLRVGYLLQREFRRGNTLWYCDARIYGTPHVMAARLLKGLARLTLGLVLFAPRAVARGRTGMMTAACDISRGWGTVAGAFGHLVLEYRTAESMPHAIAPVETSCR